jgi:hypothetical protein
MGLIWGLYYCKRSLNWHDASAFERCSEADSFVSKMNKPGFHEINYYIVNQLHSYPALSWCTVAANPVCYISTNIDIL